MKFLSKFCALLFAILFIGSLSVHPQSFAQPNHDNHHLLYKVKQAAKQGKVINSQWGVGTKKSVIVQSYGKPDHGSTEQILFYAKRHLVFNLQQGKVWRVSSTDPQLLQLTQSEVSKYFGDPKVEGAAGHQYWSYSIGKYQLIFDWQNVDPEIGKLLNVTVQRRS